MCFLSQCCQTEEGEKKVTDERTEARSITLISGIPVST